MALRVQLSFPGAAQAVPWDGKRGGFCSGGKICFGAGNSRGGAIKTTLQTLDLTASGANRMVSRNTIATAWTMALVRNDGAEPVRFSSSNTRSSPCYRIGKGEGSYTDADCPGNE